MASDNSFLYERTALMLEENQLAALKSAHILILGVGGVGGYALENLIRAGVGKITIVDGDDVDITNCNRQISALLPAVGKNKVEVWKERALAINPALEITALHKFLRSPEDIAGLLDSAQYSYAVDAIDELTPKLEFILALKQRKIPFISAMGAGGKLDPSAVKIADISQTSGCPLAKIVRKKLRENHISKGVKVVFSSEVPRKRFADRKIGSISFMPALFGTMCAAAAINTIIEQA